MIPRDGCFYPHQTTMIRFFFLHTFRSTVFDFNIGVAKNESCCFTLTSTILKVDVVCDVTRRHNDVNCNILATSYRQIYGTSYTTNVLTTHCYSFFTHPMGRLRVCRIRFVSTGENCGKPCQVCKTIFL